MGISTSEEFLSRRTKDKLNEEEEEDEEEVEVEVEEEEVAKEE